MGDADASRGRQPKLRLRGTFIDTDAHTADIALSPRALSEPRSSVTKTEELFETQQRYVEQLDQGQPAASSDVGVSPSSVPESRAQQDSPRRVLEAQAKAHAAAATPSTMRKPRSLERREVSPDLDHDGHGERWHSPGSDCGEVYVSPGSSPPPQRPFIDQHAQQPMRQMPSLPQQQMQQQQQQPRPLVGIAALRATAMQQQQHRPVPTYEAVQPRSPTHMDAVQPRSPAQTLTQQRLLELRQDDEEFFRSRDSQGDETSEVSYCSVRSRGSGAQQPPNLQANFQSSPVQAQQLLQLAGQLGALQQGPRPVGSIQQPVPPGVIMSPSNRPGWTQDAATTIGTYGRDPTEMQGYSTGGRRFAPPEARRGSWNGQSESTMSDPGINARSQMPDTGIAGLMAQRSQAIGRRGEVTYRHPDEYSRYQESNFDAHQQMIQNALPYGSGQMPKTPSVCSRHSGDGSDFHHSDVQASPQPNDPHNPNMNNMMGREDMRCKIGSSVHQMSDGSAPEHRRSIAMAVIEEIPRRIGDEMQRVANLIVDGMQSEVEAMSKIIRIQNSDANRNAVAMKVVKNLEVIPTMVRNLLEARVEKAKATVRHRISGLMQTLNMLQEEGKDNVETLVRQMRLISQEVEKIAGDAVEAAARECLEHKTRQIDFALATLARADREALMSAGIPGLDHDRDNFQDARSGKAERGSDRQEHSAIDSSRHMADRWPSTASKTGGSSFEHAAAVVQDSDFIPQSLTNQAVADELLRAKVRSGGRGQNSSLGMPNQPLATNPGSQGHPDLCLRPCLYFAAGRCVNGQECTFCHMPHPKRPLRLDKRHREILKRMPFGESLSLFLPLLRQKVVDSGPGSAEVKQGLDALTECAERYQSGEDRSHSHQMLHEVVENGRAGSQVSGPHSDVTSKDGDSTISRSQVSANTGKRKSGFAGALQVMGSRMLLSLLGRMAPPEEKLIIERILAALHENGSEMPMEDDDYQALGSLVGSNVSGGQRHGSDVGVNRHGSDVGVKRFQHDDGSDVSGSPNPNRRPHSDVGFVGGGHPMQQHGNSRHQNFRRDVPAQQPIGIAGLMAQRSGRVPMHR